MKFKTFVVPQLLLVCGACVPSSYTGAPAVMLAPDQIARGATLGALDVPSVAVADDDWSFGDPQLAQLIAHGVKDAPQFAQVLSRVRKADALVGEQRTAGGPQVNADGSLNEAQQSRDLGLPTQFKPFLPKGLHTNSRVTLGASIDADLFGRQRAAVAAARSEAEAARFDAAAARQALIASIARAYVDFADAVDGATNVRRIAAFRQQQLSLAQLRRKAGLDDDSVVVRATSDARSADEAVREAQTLILTDRYRLAALVGEGPDFGLTLHEPALALPTRSIDKVGVEVIVNRPDVAAAKVRVEAQAARVKMAKRDFYPNISLSALAGFQAFDLKNLLLGSSAIPGVGAAIHLPIFDSGRLKAAYRAQQADYDGAVATYNGTVVNALEDVSTALARLNQAQSQYATATANLADARRADVIATERLKAKIESDYGIIPVRLNVLANEARVRDAYNAVAAAYIDLLRALGGRVVDAPSGDKS